MRANVARTAGAPESVSFSSAPAWRVEQLPGLEGEGTLGENPLGPRARRERHLNHRELPRGVDQRAGQRLLPDSRERLPEALHAPARRLGEEEPVGPQRGGGPHHMPHTGQAAQFLLQLRQRGQSSGREDAGALGDDEHLRVLAGEGAPVAIEVRLGRVPDGVHPLDGGVHRHARGAQARHHAQGEQAQAQAPPVRQQSLEEGEPGHDRCLRPPERKYSISLRKPNGSRACGGRPSGAVEVSGSGQRTVPKTTSHTVSVPP